MTPTSTQRFGAGRLLATGTNLDGGSPDDTGVSTRQTGETNGCLAKTAPIYTSSPGLALSVIRKYEDLHPSTILTWRITGHTGRRSDGCQGWKTDALSASQPVRRACVPDAVRGLQFRLRLWVTFGTFRRTGRRTLSCRPGRRVNPICRAEGPTEPDDGSRGGCRQPDTHEEFASPDAMAAFVDVAPAPRVTASYQLRPRRKGSMPRPARSGRLRPDGGSPARARTGVFVSTSVYGRPCRLV